MRLEWASQMAICPGRCSLAEPSKDHAPVVWRSARNPEESHHVFDLAHGR